MFFPTTELFFGKKDTVEHASEVKHGGGWKATVKCEGLFEESATCRSDFFKVVEVPAIAVEVESIIVVNCFDRPLSRRNKENSLVPRT